MKKIKFLLTLLAICLACFAHAQRKVVFIIVDGIPADVLEQVETPVLDDISATGGYTHAYLGGEKGGYSESPTVSAVGYNHVLTGTWSNKHNVYDNSIKAPNYNYWNVFRMVQSSKPELKTAIFSSWTDNRTKLIGEGLPEAGALKLTYAYDGLEHDEKNYPHTKDRLFMHAIDEAVSKEAGKYILEQGPDLSWVYLEFTDDMGHMYGDSPQMIDAVKKADVQVGRIWNAIKEREKKFGEEWMIVITTDHGRDAKTGKNHGGHSERERKTWIVTNIKDVNTHFAQMPAAVDIAPSIIRFMKLQLPEAVEHELDGTPFIGLVSVSDLQVAKQTDNTATLRWKAIDKQGDAEVFVTTTNNFKTGGKDVYTRVGKVSVKAETYSFSLPVSEDGFYKIVLKTPHNTLNGWIVKK